LTNPNVQPEITVL